MTLVAGRSAFSRLCPGGGSAAPTGCPSHEASLQTGGLGAALAFSLQKVFRAASWSAGPPSAGTQPPSSDQTPQEGGGGGLPHSCLRLQGGLHSASLSGVPALEPVLLWKVSPRPMLPNCWEQNHILPKDTVKPPALEPVNVT